VEKLTTRQRAHLKSLAHSLKPILQVGKEGITEASIGSLEDALNTRELLKVKVLESGKVGGYDRSQGTCPEGQGNVVDVAVSTRYNYLAFSCQGGAVYLQYVGGK